MQDLGDDDNFRPARGLRRLTWPQVERIDALISSLCKLTYDGGEARIVLVIRNGKLRFAERPVLSEELRPTPP